MLSFHMNKHKKGNLGKYTQKQGFFKIKKEGSGLIVVNSLPSVLLCYLMLILKLFLLSY
jgi:hypothetical protein